MFNRVAKYPIEKIILERWSRRAMSGEPIEDTELMRLFEAARWAPSARNSQPWRFIYAHKDTPAWKKFFETLSDFNKGWAGNSSVYVLLISCKTYEEDETLARFHSFDAGAAWQNLALQGCAMGLAVRCIGSFDKEKIRREFNIPDDFDIEVLVAIGKCGKKENLSVALQEKETQTSRKSLEEIVFKDTFKK
jgi:nitroreductase